MSQIRILEPGDQAALEAALTLRAVDSLHMLWNLRQVGLKPGTAPYHGHYAGLFEGARIVGVAAHYWNGMVFLRASREAASLADLAVGQSPWPVKGFFGPEAEVAAARRALGLAAAPARLDARPEVMTLDLDDLEVPPILSDDRIQARRLRSSESQLVANWFQRFEIEVFGAKEDDKGAAEAFEQVERLRRERRLWVLARGGQIVACCGFSACHGDRVNVGPVWVPPGLRNAGYARAVVAGALLTAAREGVREACLFAEDPAATRAYLALGFETRGRMALVQLSEASCQRSA